MSDCVRRSSQGEGRSDTRPLGRIMIVTDAGRGAVDAAALAREGSAGQVDEACERSLSEQTNNTDAYGKIVWS